MKKVRRISSILFINAFFLAILPILVFGLAASLIVSGHITREIGGKNRLLSKSIRQNVSMYLENAFSELSYKTEIYERQIQTDAGNLRMHLDYSREIFLSFEAIHIMDGEGRIVEVSPYDEDIIHMSAARQEYFLRPAAGGGGYVSRTLQSAKNGNPTIALSVMGKTFTTAGFLNLAVLQRVVEFGDISPRGYVIVVDADGTVIAHKNFLFVEERQNIGKLGFIEKAIISQERSFTYRYAGENWIASAVVEPDTGWLIAVVQPFSEAFVSLYRILIILAVFIATAAVFAIFSAISNNRRIISPLKRLMTMARNISQGRYISSYESSPIEEINNLFRVLIIMSEEISLREKLLTQSSEEYSDLVNNVNSIIIKWNDKGEYTFLNKYALDYFGYAEGEILGKSLIGNTVPETDVQGNSLRDLPDKILKNPDTYMYNENEIIKKNGERVWVQWSNSPIYNDRGKVVEILSVGTDRTEKRKMEEELSKSLKEKEILLREIHHRVKNNMQIISSLLNLQSSRLRDTKAVELFRESQNRVYSMALVHELLYQSEYLSSIRFEDYINDLLNYLRDSYNLYARDVEFEVKAENIYLSIESAVPCALLINELVSNAVKHAFIGLNGGNIVITMSQEGGDYRIVVADNGRGMDIPEDGREEIVSMDTMGMQLVYGLAQQLSGRVSITSHPGTTVTVTFPASSG